METGPFDPEEFGFQNDDPLDKVPEISIDPESGLMSIINTHQSKIKVYYISIGPGFRAVTENEEVLESGS